MRKKGICILIASVMCFLLLPTPVPAASCSHEVECTDTKHCIKCGKKLKEGEAYTLAHSMVFCSDTKTCVSCNKRIKKGEKILSIYHPMEAEYGAVYKKVNGSEHKVTCACGEKTEVETHLVTCKDKAAGVCFLCKGKAESYEIVHPTYVNKNDADYHWQVCGECGELTMPKLYHYTSCLDYDDGKTSCSFCGAEDVKIREKYQGLHEAFDELVKNKKGEWIHQRYCIECQKVVRDGREPMPHKANLKYKNLKDGSHSRVCCCGYAFDDEDHVYGKYTVTRKATVSKAGKKVRTCKYCKAKQTETIFKIGKIKLSRTKYKYDGKAHKPKVNVKDSKGKKIPASFYKVIYPKNTSKVGRHTVKIVFKGNYEGTVKKTFTVKR